MYHGTRLLMMGGFSSNGKSCYSKAFERHFALPPFTAIPMAPPQVKLDFQILIYPENQWWIAHCLEMDLPAEGKTPEEALRNLYDVSQIQIADAIQRQNLASIFSAAPAELWRQYALGTQKKPRAALPSRFHRVSVREMALIGG